jgi:hypothetical protein
MCACPHAAAKYRQETIMRILCGMIVAVVISLPVWAANEQSSDTGGAESLGDKLLDDLAPRNPQRDDNTPSPNVPPPGEHFAPRSSPLAPSQPVAPDLIPLARVRQGMQNAQALLAQPGAETHVGTIKLAGTTQREVVSELDQLIAQLSKQCQCQGGACDKPPQPNPNGKPKPGTKPGNAVANGKAPARDSSDRLDRTSAQSVKKGDLDDVVKELWGHLPERSREQMLQSFSEEFLPKYELEIEQYYRRLGEEQSAARAKASPNQ